MNKQFRNNTQSSSGKRLYSNSSNSNRGNHHVFYRGIAVFILIFSILFMAGCMGDLIQVDITPSNNNSDAPVVFNTPTGTEPLIETPVPTPAPTVTPLSTVYNTPNVTPPMITPSPLPTIVPTNAASHHAGTVYLTFDDGPAQGTMAVLDVLARYNIKATFFTVGQFVDYNPAIAKRIVDEGHVIACHTYSHEFGIIYKSPQAFMEDVRHWRRAVEKAVGYDAGGYILRFPGGSNNTTVGGRAGRGEYVNAVRYNGYRAYDWNLALNDKWPGGNTQGLPFSEYLWQSYLRTLDMYKNSGKPLILIAHDTVPESIELLPRIIEDLILKGYDFATLEALESDYLM